MSINSISSTQALYESLLKKTTAKTQTAADDAYAKSLQVPTDASTESAKPTADDIKSLLAKLAGSQPSLMDFLSDDSTSTDGTSDPFGSLDPLSGLDSTSGSDDVTSFDPISQMLKAFSNSDSSSASDSDSNNPFSSLLSSIGSSLSPSELSNLLEKAYSQSSQDVQSEIAAGQIIDKKK
jgi:hypothetical protein